MKRNLSIRNQILIGFLSILSIAVISTVILMNYAVKEMRPEKINLPREEVLRSSPMMRQFILEQISTQREISQANVVKWSLIVISGQVLLTIGAGYYISKKVISPIEDLDSLMSEISKDLKYKKLNLNDPNAVKELISLSESFNNMMQRLEQAFESQKEFVENVSHEIKTPLTIIKSNLESIDTTKGESEKDTLEAIESSVESVNFLDNLTEDLLLLSILDRKDIPLEDFKLENALKNIEDRLQKLAKNKSQKLIIKNELKNIILSGNQNLFERAISNIVENSIKYSPQKTSVTVKTKLEKEKVTISITDQGPGIPIAEHTKIFDRFYRVDKSRARATGGKGLGLAITKEIIEKMDGQIKVESTDTGSTFMITFSNYPLEG